MKTAIDFNCCAGQVSLALKNAGYRLLAGVDNDEVALDAHKVNHPHTKSILMDLGSDRAPEHLDWILKSKSPDLIWMSPPCQSFSMQGHRNENDPRRLLYMKELELALRLQPNSIIVENVAAIISGEAKVVVDSAINLLHHNEYKVHCVVLDAQHYGVAQRRKRHFLIAKKCGNIALAPAMQPKRTVQDAFASMGPDRWERTKHQPQTIKRYSQVKPGDKDPVGWHYRLKWDDVAPTLTAGSRHASKQGGANTPCRPIHPEMNRLITVEEAIRLQGLPDDFELHKSISLALHFIGEGVPPSLASAALSMLDA